MTITTKFDIGDVAFFISENIVKSGCVRLIHIFKSSDAFYTEYELVGGNVRLTEKQIFKTKEELLASL